MAVGSADVLRLDGRLRKIDLSPEKTDSYSMKTTRLAIEVVNLVERSLIDEMDPMTMLPRNPPIRPCIQSLHRHDDPEFWFIGFSYGSGPGRDGRIRYREILTLAGAAIAEACGYRVEGGGAADAPEPPAIVAGHPATPTEKQPRKGDACRGFFVDCLNKSFAPSLSQIARHVGCDKSTASRATKSLRRRFKEAAKK